MRVILKCHIFFIKSLINFIGGVGPIWEAASEGNRLEFFKQVLKIKEVKMIKSSINS